MKKFLCIILFFSFLPSGLIAEKNTKQFQTYTSMFNYIASQCDLPDRSEETIMKLVGDSNIKRISGLSDKEILLIIETNYYKFSNGYFVNLIRGASGNGDSFIFRCENETYEYIGIIQGNGYKINNISEGNKETMQFITTWHMSAGEYNEAIYQWDGMEFKHLKTQTIKSNIE